MILIFSSEDDNSTNDVIDWLNYYKISYYRINPSSIVEVINIRIEPDNFQFTLKIAVSYLPGKIDYINSDEISSYWYRRGHFTLTQRCISIEAEADEITEWLLSGINRYLTTENDKIPQLFHLYFKKIKNLGSFIDNHANKFYNLFLASKNGLIIPKSLVTNSKEELLAFYKKTGPCILKSLDNGGFDIDKKIGIGSNTALLKEADFSNIPPTFNYTLIQQFIDKLYDLRVFYLNESFYTCAILSQTNKKTKIDFRNYDSERPNRKVPYKLPREIERNLSALMKELDMKTGSIDLVKDKDNYYYFLEINPIGQYQFISRSCNYHLDKKIVEFLA